jgi:hypothetical protein
LDWLDTYVLYIKARGNSLKVVASEIKKRKKNWKNLNSQSFKTHTKGKVKKKKSKTQQRDWTMST